jgi:hypothetical protein
MKNISRIILVVLSFCIVGIAFAGNAPSDVGFGGEYPDGTILDGSDITVVGVLALIQSLLLTVALPIIIVGG